MFGSLYRVVLFDSFSQDVCVVLIFLSRGLCCFILSQVFVVLLSLDCPFACIDQMEERQTQEKRKRGAENGNRMHEEAAGEGLSGF